MQLHMKIQGFFKNFAFKLDMAAKTQMIFPAVGYNAERNEQQHVKFKNFLDELDLHL